MRHLVVPLDDRDEYLSLNTGVSLTYESKLSRLSSQTQYITLSYFLMVLSNNNHFDSDSI